MVKDELSELEIKLINATRRFARELNEDVTAYLFIKENKNRTKTSIGIKNFHNVKVCYITYQNNAELGVIEVHEKISMYGNFLKKIIPEIKDRIKY